MAARILVTIGVAVTLLLSGCQGMQWAGQAQRPVGVPAEATLIGGGFPEGLTLPTDGLLYIVDSKANAAVATIQVKAAKPIALNEDMVMRGMQIARYGFGPVPRTQTSAEPSHTDQLLVELYFMPMEALNLESSDNPAAR